MSDSTFRSLLNKSGKLFRPSESGTPNDFGERRSEPGTEVLTLNLSLQPLKEKLELTMSGHVYLVELCAFMEMADIREMDILEVDSKKYLVTGVEDEAGQGHHLKVYLVKR